MNNKYNVSLTDDEKQQLVDNIKKITNYLKDLVKPFCSQANLSAEWSYFDKVWGNQTCHIEVEKTFRYKGTWGDSEKEWYTKVNGQVGGLFFDFENNMTLEKINISCYQEYALSLLDNWVLIKTLINEQVKQRETTRQLLVGFEL